LPVFPIIRFLCRRRPWVKHPAEGWSSAQNQGNRTALQHPEKPLPCPASALTSLKREDYNHPAGFSTELPDKISTVQAIFNPITTSRTHRAWFPVLQARQTFSNAPAEGSANA
jgi:hypothetical protein